MEEEGFLLALAANPADTLVHLVYADWLDERNDPGGLCLRYWVELISAPFSEAAFPTQRRLLDGYRLALSDADPEWVELVERTRSWVTGELAELAARLYLRAVEGRMLDRQWLDAPRPGSFDGWWHVPYWPRDPDFLKQRKRTAWLMRRTLIVEPVTAMVSLARPVVGRPPDQPMQPPPA